VADLQRTITTLAISLEPVGRLPQRVPGGGTKRRRSVTDSTAIEEPADGLPPAEDAA
jgi:hypothetical protein